MYFFSFAYRGASFNWFQYIYLTHQQDECGTENEHTENEMERIEQYTDFFLSYTKIHIVCLRFGHTRKWEKKEERNNDLHQKCKTFTQKEEEKKNRITKINLFGIELRVSV